MGDLIFKYKDCMSSTHLLAMFWIGSGCLLLDSAVAVRV